jgi:pimeloyl-ACP methyl ester carboxylesterase
LDARHTVARVFTPAHRGGSGTPLVLLHGFTDTWRTWELVLPALERRHDVLAVTLAGHAGGPDVEGPMTDDTLVDAVEQAMDEAGMGLADVAGNSLGGYLALRLAARGRARSVVALAPAGGWKAGDTSYEDALEHFATMQRLLEGALPHVDTIVSTPEGRRRATTHVAERSEHLSPDLVAHLMRGAAGCTAVFDFIEHARRNGWPLDAARVRCPVRVVWGTADRLLPWPTAARRYRQELPTADWVELDGVGHCPQLDVPLEAAELVLGWTAP